MCPGQLERKNGGLHNHVPGHQTISSTSGDAWEEEDAHNQRQGYGTVQKAVLTHLISLLENTVFSADMETSNSKKHLYL